MRICFFITDSFLSGFQILPTLVINLEGVGGWGQVGLAPMACSLPGPSNYTWYQIFMEILKHSLQSALCLGLDRFSALPKSGNS